jgi:alginate O-acetyltransferase complex protein AlgI
MLNFNLPYLSTNPQEFWTRWHISLSSWLRDYLYIPLGGNRGGEAKTRRNLMLTMVIGGFWHGAAWNFLLWGFYQGALLVIHRIVKPYTDPLFEPKNPIVKRLLWAVSVIVFFQFTCYGWLLFRATSFAQIANMTGSLLTPWQGFPVDSALKVLLYASPLILVQLIQYFTKKLEFLNFEWIPAEAKVALYAAFAYLVLFRGGQPQAFIYFQF